LTQYDVEQLIESCRLRADLAAVGDFRPGSLSAVMRRCDKANCACADPAHPGHGPQHVLTRKVAGKTVSVYLWPGPELAKARSRWATTSGSGSLWTSRCRSTRLVHGAEDLLIDIALGSAPGGPAGAGIADPTRAAEELAGRKVSALS